MGEPASPSAVEQLKLSRQLVTLTGNLIEAFKQSTAAVLDNIEAVDGLREEIKGVSEQLSGMKVDITQETVDDGGGT